MTQPASHVAPFDCYLVTKNDDGSFAGQVTKCSLDELPPGELLIRVAYSSLNYKDALSATGHPGVTRKFPHVPGIDAAGAIVESTSPDFHPGQHVLVTGFDLGVSHWGGFAEFIRVPAAWVVPLPTGLTLHEAMIYGTAGFTAGLSVQAIVDRGIATSTGEVVVTGASGGVGSLAAAMLAHLGYRVVAVSGKADTAELLSELGAARVTGREEVSDASDKPLLAARWAAAVDTVGGKILATIIRSTAPHGCVTACGMVAGVELPLNVYPFILRGVELVGIDSVSYPREKRLALWEKLAGPWKPPQLERLATTIRLDQLSPYIQTILGGRSIGRIVVRPGKE